MISFCIPNGSCCSCYLLCKLFFSSFVLLAIIQLLWKYWSNFVKYSNTNTCTFVSNKVWTCVHRLMNFQNIKSTTVEVIFNVLQIYLWHEFKNIQQTFQCYISVCERKKNEWCLLKLSLNCDFQRSLIHFIFFKSKSREIIC